MEYELPSEFDIIIVGTGVVESSISAAASRIGKEVLHIDNNNFYGAHWASFNLDTFLKLNIKSEPKIAELPQGLIADNEKVVHVGNNSLDIKDFEIEWNIPETTRETDIPTEENEESNSEVSNTSEATRCWTQESLLKESRKFNIDMTPKLQFARGDFVELLISSNIARYSEYRSVSRVLTWLNGQLEVVPCSRSDVFANNKVTIIEKRMLMKLFTSLDNDEKELSGHEDKTFRTFLKEKKLTPNLIHYVLYAISMSTDETSCLQGIKNTKRFLNSLGRFGKTPFLFSMYGSGEITQAFCRLSAVFGGVYALNQPLNGYIIDENNTCRGIICGNQRINSKQFVMGVEKAPEYMLSGQLPEQYISRAIFITDRSILDSEKEHLTLLLYPPEHDKNACVVIELGSLTGTCPQDLYIVHLTARQITSPKEDFKHCIQNLFNVCDESKPKILWSCYFSIPDSNHMCLDNDNVPSNVRICPGPDLDLDYDFSITKARKIFSGLWPECEFLPRAPDPEEIIIGGGEAENDGEIVSDSSEAKEVTE